MSLENVEREVAELKEAIATYKGARAAKEAELTAEIEALKANGVDVARLEAVAAELDAMGKDLVPAVEPTPVVEEPTPA